MSAYIIQTSNKRDDYYFSTLFLCLFIILSAVNSSQFGTSLSFVIVPMVLYIGALFIELYTQKKIFRLTMLHFLALIFWAYVVVVTLLSDIVTAQRDLITWLVFTIFLVFTTGINYNDTEIKWIIYSFVAQNLIYTAKILSTIITSSSVGRISVSFFGVTKDPNYAAGTMVVGCMSILYLLFLNKKIWQKIFLALLFALSCFAIFSTGSRGSFISLVISCFFLILFIVSRIKKLSFSLVFKALLVFIALLFALKVVWALVPENLTDRLTDTAAYSDNIRLSLWSTCINAFSKNPIIGYGQGAAPIILQQNGFRHVSHNVYIDVLTNFGLVGFFLYFLLLFIPIWNCKSKIFLITAVGIALCAPQFFINGLNTTLFWNALILLNVLSEYLKKSPGFLLMGEIKVEKSYNY